MAPRHPAPDPTNSWEAQFRQNLLEIWLAPQETIPWSKESKGSVNGHVKQDHRHLMNGTVSAGRGGGPEDRAEGNETVSGDLKRNSLEHRSVQKEPMAHTQWPKLYLTVSIFTQGTKGVPQSSM